MSIEKRNVHVRVSFRVSFFRKNKPLRGGQLAGKVPKKQKKHGEAYLK